MPGMAAESQVVFRHCLGKAFNVEFVDKNGLLCLDVSREADARFGGRCNSILVEPRCVVRL